MTIVLTYFLHALNRNSLEMRNPLFPHQGSLGIGQKVFHEFLDSGPRKIMLLGPVEDSLAKSVAAYSGIPDVNLLQVRIIVTNRYLFNRNWERAV